MEAVVEDRRRHARVPPDQSEWRHLRLRTGDVLTIVDISAGGALVETPRRLLPGVTLVVHMTSADRALTLDARVVRCWLCALDPGGCVRYRGALEFTGIHRTAAIRASRPQ